MSAPRSPLLNILWLVGERVARVGITATLFALVARHLQPEGFGRLNLALTATAIAAALASLGLDSLVVHQLVRRTDAPGAVLGTALRLRMIASGATWLGLAVIGALLPDLRGDLVLMLLAATSLLFSPAEVVDLCFQRHLDSRRTVLVRFATTLVGAGLRLALIAGDAGVTPFIIVHVAETALLAAAMAWSYRRSPYAGPAWTWDSSLAREFLRRGLPLAAAGVLVALAMRLDQLLVRTWLGEHAAGVYFSAAKLIEVALLTAATFTVSLFPGLSEGHGQSEQVFAARLQAQFDAMSALGWSVALACTLFSPWVIPLMYGDSYRAAVPVLIWKGWGALIALNAAVRWQFILLNAPTSLNLVAALLSIGCQLGLTAWWAPRWGLGGVAAAWTLAAIGSGLLSTFLFRPLHPVAVPQLRGLLIPFAPARWPAMLAQFRP